MKILIEAQRVLRKKKAGMDIVVLNILNQLAKLRHDFEIVVVAQEGDDIHCLDHLPFELIITKKSNYLLWEQYVLPSVIKSVKPDLVHCTSNTAPILGVNVPLVLTVHDLIYLDRGLKESFKGSTYQVMGNFYRQNIVPRAIKNAKKIITVSEFEALNIVQKFPELKGKVMVVYNGVSEHFKVSNERFSNEYGKYFFHLGNTEPRKNSKGVIKAFAHYRMNMGGKARLLLNGLKLDVIEKWLREVNGLEVLKHIVDLGFIADEDLPRIYHNATGFLFPSFREGFGMPPLEAMSAGTVVVSAKNSSLDEVCADAAYYIDPYDHKDIANAMLVIENGATIRTELITKGRANITRFTWEGAAEKTLSIYKSVLSSSTYGVGSEMNLAS